MARLSLTAQQVSLVRAVILDRADYLQHSFLRDPASGRRYVSPLDPHEESHFVACWAVEPIACIRMMNAAIATLDSPARIRRYLEAAVDLETLMDRRALRLREGTVFAGIPSYIMDGYTDMGRNASPSERRGREKIRVDKEGLKPWLVKSRGQALAPGMTPEELLLGFYTAVRSQLTTDESRVFEMSSAVDAESIYLARFLEEGVGVCRHQSILYQLCLQEAGIPARMVKGTVRFCGFRGRHAWNLVWLSGRVALVDVTLPWDDGPLLLVGGSREEAYALAASRGLRYDPTPDEENHYKIGAVREPGATDLPLPSFPQAPPGALQPEADAPAEEDGLPTLSRHAPQDADGQLHLDDREIQLRA